MFVYNLTPEIRTPHESGHFLLSQGCRYTYSSHAKLHVGLRTIRPKMSENAAPDQQCKFLLHVPLSLYMHIHVHAMCTQTHTTKCTHVHAGCGGWYLHLPNHFPRFLLLVSRRLLFTYGCGQLYTGCGRRVRGHGGTDGARDGGNCSRTVLYCRESLLR